MYVSKLNSSAISVLFVYLGGEISFDVFIVLNVTIRITARQNYRIR